MWQSVPFLAPRALSLDQQNNAVAESDNGPTHNSRNMECDNVLVRFAF